MKTEIGERLRQVLQREKLSQAALAKRLNVSQPFVSEVVRGECLPSIQMIVGLKAEFGVSPEWFLVGTARRAHEELHARLDRLLAGADDEMIGQIAGYLDGLAAARPKQKTA